MEPKRARRGPTVDLKEALQAEIYSHHRAEGDEQREGENGPGDSDAASATRRERQATPSGESSKVPTPAQGCEERVYETALTPFALSTAPPCRMNDQCKEFVLQHSIRFFSLIGKNPGKTETPKIVQGERECADSVT